MVHEEVSFEVESNKRFAGTCFFFRNRFVSERPIGREIGRTIYTANQKRCLIRHLSKQLSICAGQTSKLSVQKWLHRRLMAGKSNKSQQRLQQIMTKPTVLQTLSFFGGHDGKKGSRKIFKIYYSCIHGSWVCTCYRYYESPFETAFFGVEPDQTLEPCQKNFFIAKILIEVSKQLQKFVYRIEEEAFYFIL